MNHKRASLLTLCIRFKASWSMAVNPASLNRARETALEQDSMSIPNRPAIVCLKLREHSQLDVGTGIRPTNWKLINAPVAGRHLQEKGREYGGCRHVRWPLLTSEALHI
ncbi:hypothetical protein PGT21_031856 [Puccinia graminis f. sp. tritici]|uniref:Secreted protein n=1 Tax=Puccinia graminis f. sp. tritici TaxID=56615 RepID=A0A5B0PPH0_PUCGR|nr:hypothetical protein PGT21_031856 [Puccinia graminis f. sp. tritici]